MKETRGFFTILRKVGQLVAPHKWWVIGSAVLAVAALALELVAPLLLKVLIDRTLVERNLAQLDRIIAVFAIIYLAKFVFDLIGSRLKIRFNENVIRDGRRKLYDHLQRLSLPFFHQNRTGYLTGRYLSDTNLLGGLLGDTLLGGLSNVLLVLGAVSITFYLNWRLTLVLLVVVPALALVTHWFGVRIRTATSEMQEQISHLCGNLQENLSGIALIQSYTMEGYASRRIGASLGNLRRVNVRLGDLGLVQRTGTVLMTSMAGLAILSYGGRELVRGALTMGDLMAFLAYAVNVYRPVQALLSLNVSVQKSLVAAERFFELMDTAPTVTEAADARPLATPVAGAVRYRDVSFAYEDGRDVLSGVDFVLEPGTKVAVVGRSGAGKTTLLNLLSRFYDPRQGRLEIDGQDLRTLELASLRRQIAVVSQETFLFDGTIRENLRCCRPEASDEELARAVEMAQLRDFVDALPQGLDTEVGERGVRISGGERQRLSIARALLKDPPILVLDEATSSVDSISERLIKEALGHLLEERTCFIIAHRFATILDADRILVLEEGRLVGDGQHDELYERNPTYHQLFDEQFAPGKGNGAAAASTEHYLMRSGDQQSRILVRTDGAGLRRVEVTPVSG